MGSKCSFNKEVNGKRHQCNRLTENQFCVLHDPNLDRHTNLFISAIKDTLFADNYEECDFRGVKFPQQIDQFKDAEILKPAFFDGATFLATTNFANTHFKNICSFASAIFEKTADFAKTTFHDKCTFEGVGFYGTAHFNGVTFLGESNFNKGEFRTDTFFDEAEFHEKTSFDNRIFHTDCSFKSAKFFKNVNFKDTNFSRNLDFYKTEFNGVTKFTKTVIHGRPKFESTIFAGDTTFKNEFRKLPVFLKNCNLNGLNILGLPKIEDELHFENCKWPRKKYYFRNGRTIIHDEEKQKPNEVIVDIYRKLHEYYYKKSYFDLSREFYVGFMISMRKASKWDFGKKALDFTYSTISKYGESIRRPLVAIIMLWLLCPILLLYNGIKLDPDTDKLTEIIFSYDGSLVFLMEDYWKTFLLNISYSTLFRSDALRPSITSIQHAILLIETLLNAILISFLVLGIKRHFVPKKPI